MRRGRILVGTSGWHYAHWVGPFYPPGTRADAFLAHYVGRFRTVEINNTFYELPGRRTFTAWRAAAPPGFVFAVKASRYITHMKKLRAPRRSVARFFRAVAALGPRLGPVLFQLPPRFHRDAGRLAAFLGALPRGRRYAFEFRDPTWFAAEIYRVLEAHGAACCAWELAGVRSPVEVTADFVYVRLHGPGGAYQGRYGAAGLRPWARRCRAWQRAGRDVYCYFDNDEAGYAALDALTLDRLVGGAGRCRAALRRAGP